MRDFKEWPGGRCRGAARPQFARVAAPERSFSLDVAGEATTGNAARAAYHVGAAVDSKFAWQITSMTIKR
ncbi:hypothetical protein [Paraburkholderia lycopersici]|uniref:Uncharacterized protein n=1 Tax=Paraburkholderia lycopersici TaxID=416944 RepID=A0A1G6XHY6_9BURK|nr:hypothetical protein [Paraburkholderia lycopersici]SDD77770.1 hypothetical protein SAMN05421548_12549 [Paraburkholderia lycopersici]